MRTVENFSTAGSLPSPAGQEPPRKPLPAWKTGRREVLLQNVRQVVGMVRLSVASNSDAI